MPRQIQFRASSASYGLDVSKSVLFGAFQIKTSVQGSRLGEVFKINI